MPLESEDLQKIQELIEASSKSFADKLSESTNTLKTEFTQQIGGVKAWSKKAIVESSNGIRGELETSLKSLLSDDNSESEPKQASESQGKPDKPVDKTAHNQSTDSSTVNQLGQLFNQVKAQKQMMEDLKKSLAETESARQESEKIAKRSQLNSDFISKVSDKVVDPRTFLGVLESQGKIFESEGRLVAKTGKFDIEGKDELVDATSLVDAYLTSEYSYFAKPRPGNGSGSQPSNTDSQTGKIFLKDDVSATDLLAAMKAGKESEVLGELG